MRIRIHNTGFGYGEITKEKTTAKVVVLSGKRLRQYASRLPDCLLMVIPERVQPTSRMGGQQEGLARVRLGHSHGDQGNGMSSSFFI
jgi:hypothetical protein